ncbi:MAG: hypothetical protein WB561_07910 [Terracidiphilus sp.]
MNMSKAILSVSVFFVATHVCSAQPGGAGTPVATAGPTNSTFTPAAPSEILQRSLDEVQQTVGAVKLDKWKRGTVRDEAETNIDAIQRDMNGTLPALMKEADAAPGTLSKVLPLSRNIDALYDVMVHVVEAARIVAPGDQVGELKQAMADLETARVAFGDQIQQTAAVQEKHISELRTTVQVQAASLKAVAAAPPAPKCPVPPTPAKKKKVAPKSTTAKPAAGTPATTPAGTSTTPAKPQ